MGCHAWIAAVLQSGVNIGILVAVLAHAILARAPHRSLFLVGVLPALLRLLPAAAGYLRGASVTDIAVPQELPAEFRRATRWGMLTGPAAYVRSARRQARVAAEAQREAPR